MEVTPIGATAPRSLPVNGAALSTSAPSNGNAVYKDSLWCTYQVISSAAATVIIQGTNDQLTAEGTNSNWCPVTGSVSSSTITLSAGGTAGLVEITGTAWRWVRASVTAATAPTTVLMGV